MITFFLKTFLYNCDKNAILTDHFHYADIMVQVLPQNKQANNKTKLYIKHAVTTKVVRIG